VDEILYTLFYFILIEGVVDLRTGVEEKYNTLN
jgi:hypothetical protein